MAYVQQVNAQAGDHVREGQALVVLDARDLEANLRRAEAGRAEVESAIAEVENATAAAKANLDLAQTTFKRMEELASKKSISSQELDEASARLKSAQANYEMVRSRRTQITSKMAPADQEIRATKIMRDYAEHCRAIFRRGDRQNRGARQSGNARRTAAHHRAGRALPPGGVGGRIQAGVRALGQAVGGGDRSDRPKLNARVSEIVPAVDAASRTYIVKLDLPATPQLRTGMFGRAVFPLGAQRVVAIPPAALLERGQMQSVFVVEDGVAHTRLVTSGRRTQHWGRSAVRPERGGESSSSATRRLAGWRQGGGSAMSASAPPGSCGTVRPGVDLLQADAAVNLRGRC